MELWIRSQDRRRLLPINDELYVPISRTDEDFGIFYTKTMLGHYKTKERALEVLDEIQRHLVIINDKDDNLFYVYEMPEE